nr:hypothetical protein [Caulobacter sp. Root1472]
MIGFSSAQALQEIGAEDAFLLSNHPILAASSAFRKVEPPLTTAVIADPIQSREDPGVQAIEAHRHHSQIRQRNALTFQARTKTNCEAFSQSKQRVVISIIERNEIEIELLAQLDLNLIMGIEPRLEFSRGHVSPNEAPERSFDRTRHARSRRYGPRPFSAASTGRTHGRTDEPCKWLKNILADREPSTQGGSTTTGANMGSDDGGGAIARNSRRQVNSCVGAKPYRRATEQAVSRPLQLSATIWRLACADHVRRWRAPVKTSSRRTGAVSVMVSSGGIVMEPGLPSLRARTFQGYKHRR